MYQNMTVTIKFKDGSVRDIDNVSSVRFFSINSHFVTHFDRSVFPDYSFDSSTIVSYSFFR